jgi:hypothetical protein
MCGAYLEKTEGFICPKCRRGPLCKSHLATEKRICVGCLFGEKSKIFDNLKNQERSIKGFLRFVQFIFILAAIYFVSMKFGALELVDFLKISFLTETILYIVGALSILGYVIFYSILL